MIDFHLRSFMDALAYLYLAQTRAQTADPYALPTAEGMDQINDHLGKIRKACVQLDMPTVIGRLSRIEVFFGPSGRGTNDVLKHEIDELIDAVERDAREEFFCHYPKQLVGSLIRIEAEWRHVFEAFRSSRNEVEEGIDCYVLGHNAACVFHMMRVSEIGLRAIARERGIKKIGKNKPVEYGTWGEVIKSIEDEMIKIRLQAAAGPKKENALEFYSTAAADLRQLLSNFRDRTMHLRGSFDVGQAGSAIIRTRGFMSMLATKLNEDRPRRIRWGL